MSKRGFGPGSLARVLLIVIALGLPCGCMKPKQDGSAAPAKKQTGALSDEQAKAAGKTIHTALQKNAKGEKGAGVEIAGTQAADASALKGAKAAKPIAGDAGPTQAASADRKAPSLVPKQVPEMNYAVMDTARLAAIMDDIVLTPEPYYYSSVGRRDLFESLLKTDDSKAKTEPNGEPTSDELRVVGILWAEHDRFALVEAPDGRSRILREGDSLGDGTVAHVYPDKVTVHVTEYGTSRNVTLPLVQGGGFDESPRSRGR